MAVLETSSLKKSFDYLIKNHWWTIDFAIANRVQILNDWALNEFPM